MDMPVAPPRAPGRPAGELLAQAIRTNDIGDIKSVPRAAFASATVAQRVRFIDALVHQTWVGPLDEIALEGIWNSFGQNIATVAGANHALWRLSVAGGMDPSNIRAVDGLRSAFERDVKSVAQNYMRRNREMAEREMERLGIRAPAGGASPTQETEQAIHIEETQEYARAARALLDAKGRMRRIFVGYNYVRHPMGGGMTTPAYFDPEHRPESRAPSMLQPSAERPGHTWEEVKQTWDQADAALAGVSARNPTVFAALAQGGDSVRQLATGSPRQAQSAAREVLTTLHRNIVATIPKLGTGDLDWRDLAPIHQQLYAGRVRGASGTDWTNAFTQSVAKDVIGDHETTEFWISLGLGAAAAALFIVAEVLTGGLATAALLGGLAASGTQAVMSWENYEDLATAAGSSASAETRLVSEGQVDAARLQAILDTVFALFDVAAPAVRAGRAAMSAARLEAALVERGAEAALIRLGSLEAAEAAQAVQRGIAELGVEGTMRRSGRSLDELTAILRGRRGAESALARLEEARRLGLGAAEAAAGAEGRAVLSVAGNAGEEAWKGTRSLRELVADVPRAVEAGTISRAFADRVISEAVERLGPAEVLRRSGGWKKLSQVLSDQSAAGSRFLEWRNSVFADLERYVRDELGGQVQRTGTATRFSNDIDMSFLGANAAEVRNGAAAYLARRLGVANSPREFDMMMMAGLFTDPRRMHMYDTLPAAIRDAMAGRQAAKERGLIWNRRLWEALQEGDEGLAQTVRDQMRTVGVPEFRYRPLSSGDVTRLSRRLDRLHGELNQAISRGDLAAQQRLAEGIADSQALINAAEGGGYFSGGGVRRWVSERPGEPGFPRLPGGEGHAIPTAERLTAILDQLPHLDHSALRMTGPADEIVAGVRGIGKYGERLAAVSAEAGAHQSAAWRSLIRRCRALKRAADSGETVARLSASEADAVVREARTLFNELIRRSGDVLATVRAANVLPNIPNAARRIQYMTTAHVKLLRATDWALGHLHILARGVRVAARTPGGVEPSPGTSGEED